MDNPQGARHNPRPMHRRSFFALLALAATLASTLASGASCRCSRDSGKAADGIAAQRSDAAPARSEILAEQSLQLDNGLHIELVHGPCGDPATLAVLLHVGIDHDPTGRSGLVQLLRRLLSASLAGLSVERLVETGDDYTLYAATVADDQLLAELDAVASWMARLPATEVDLDRERTAMLRELDTLRGADPAATARSFAEESVRPTSGDGKRNGIAAEIEAITLAELQAFWTAHVTAGNARVVVQGRFDAKQVRERIDAALAPLPRGTPPVAREPAGGSARGTLVMGETPSAIAVAVPAPAQASPHYPPFLLLADRLMSAASASVWAVEYDPIRRPGLLFITGEVDQTEQPGQAARRIRGDVDKLLGEPLAQDDVTRAGERFRLLLAARLTEPSLCARNPRAFAIARLRRTQLQGAPQASALDDIEADQLAAAREFFGPRRTAAVVAGGAIR